MTDALRRRFQRLFNKPADAVFARLVARYGEPARHYHTLIHIADCLDQMDSAPPVEGGRLIELALWWHDAIYDPQSSGNEAASAKLAIADLADLGVAPDEAAEVARLIELTSGHKVGPDAPMDARLVSVDLSILGREAKTYDRYVANVRAEYAHVPEAAWRLGRPRIIAPFLEGPVYADPWFEERLGDQARANIRREIASLEV